MTTIMTYVGSSSKADTVPAARPVRSGEILVERGDLRVTLLELPVRGETTYRSRRFKKTLQISSGGAALQAMQLDLCRSEVLDVRFNQLLIECFNGEGWVSHTPTAMIRTRNGWSIEDVQDDFASSFAVYHINEEAGAALGCPATTLEPHQVASPAIFDLARELVAHGELTAVGGVPAHALAGIAVAKVSGKGEPIMADLARAKHPARARDRASCSAAGARSRHHVRGAAS